MTNGSGSTMRVSVREARLFTDRLLMLTGLELGLIPAVREFLLAAETVGEGAFRFVHDELLAVTDIAAPRLAVTAEWPGVAVVDCAGQYAPVIGPSLLDFISLRVGQAGPSAVHVERVRYPSLLRGLVPLANRRGILTVILTGAGAGSLAAAVGLGRTTEPALVGCLSPAATAHATGERSSEAAPFGMNGANDLGASSTAEHALAGSCLILATATGAGSQPGEEAAAGIGPELWQVLVEGFEAESDIWWTLYHRSNDALTRTSEMSRTHTGAGNSMETGW